MWTGPTGPSVTPKASQPSSGILGGIGTVLGGPIGGLIGSAVGGIFSARSARKRNEQQIQMAREQMAFQERMSSTAYQRSAKDLEQAGLNRILALGKPASSPGGAMAQIEDVGPKAVSTALGVRRLTQELKNMQATELLTTRQAVTEQARANYIQSQDANIQAGTQQTIESTRNTVLRRIGISHQNEINRFESDIRKARLPGIQAEESFWKMLMSTDTEAAAVALGKWGPMALQAIRAYFAINRGKQ